MKLSRKLSNVHKYFYKSGEKKFNVCLGIRINKVFSDSELIEALLKIQKKHYLLGARVEKNGDNDPEFVIDSLVPNIPLRRIEWKQEDTWKLEVEKELLTPFDGKKGPLIRLLSISGAEVSDLIFTCYHGICDAQSLVIIMSELLTLLDNKDAEIGKYPMYDHLADFSPVVTSKAIIKGFVLKLIIGTVSLITKLKNSNKKEEELISSTGVLYWTIPPQQTMRLLKACKDKGVTVNSALLTAFARANASVLGDGETPQTSTNAVNMRSYLPKLKKDVFDVIVSTVTVKIDSKIESDFWETASKVNKVFKEQTEKEKMKDTVTFFNKFMSSDDLVNISRYNKGDNSFEVSNMGRLQIPEKYETFDVEKSLGFLANQPWVSSNVLFFSTFKNEMSIIHTCNKKVINDKKMEAIRDISRQQLENACK